MTVESGNSCILFALRSREMPQSELGRGGANARMTFGSIVAVRINAVALTVNWPALARCSPALPSLAHGNEARLQLLHRAR